MSRRSAQFTTRLALLVAGLLAACTPVTQCLAGTGGVVAGLDRAWHTTPADTTPAYITVGEAPMPDPDHMVLVHGLLGPSVLPLLHGIARVGEFAEYAGDWDVRDELLVSLVIDSPGGDVTTGRLVTREMDRVRALGVTVRCYVVGQAASMAMQILAHCDERYLSPRARLMWHRPFILIGPTVVPPLRLTGPIARQLADRAQIQDTELYEDLEESLVPAGMSQEVLRASYDAETVWSVGGLLGNAPGWGRELTEEEVSDLLEVLTTNAHTRGH